mgnify:FL=1
MLLIGYFGIPTEESYPYKASNSTYGSPYTEGICASGSNIFLPSGTKLYSYSNISDSDAQAILSVSPFVAVFYVA